MRNQLVPILGIALFALIGVFPAQAADAPASAPTIAPEPAQAFETPADEQALEASVSMPDQTLGDFVAALNGSVEPAAFSCPGLLCDTHGECRHKLVDCWGVPTCEGAGPATCDGECVCC